MSDELLDFVNALKNAYDNANAINDTTNESDDTQEEDEELVNCLNEPVLISVLDCETVNLNWMVFYLYQNTLSGYVSGDVKGESWMC